MSERYCFENDEDGHWYLIPVSKKELFEQLLYKEDDEYEKFNEEFGTLMLSTHISNYSFEIPNEN